MFIGKKYAKQSAFYPEFLEYESEQTIAVGRRLIQIGLPLLIYFLCQDCFIVGLPQLIFFRLILIIPLLAYAYYLFFYQNKTAWKTEFMHTGFLFSLIMHMVVILWYVIQLEGTFGIMSRQVFWGILVDIVVVYAFACISMRWFHMIVGIPSLLIVYILLFENAFPMVHAWAFTSNLVLGIALLVTKANYEVKSHFEEFIIKKEFAEELSNNEEANKRLQVLLDKNEALTDKLKTLATYDDLTGTYSRAIGLKTLSSDLEKCHHQDLVASIVFIDIDGLKEVNDLWGHTIGDELINCVVEGVSSVIRSTDYMIRLGGDEFLVIMSGCEEERAEQLIKKSLVLLRKSSSKYECSFSYGITEYDPEAPKDIDELIHEADTIMYMNKKSKKALKF